MRAIADMLTCAVTLGLTLCAASGWAASPSIYATLVTGQIPSGQQESSPGDGPQLPSQRFSVSSLPFAPPPANRPPAAAPNDPFAVRQRQLAIDSLTDDSKGRAITNLEKGRAALQAGNTVAALSYYQKAMAAGASFGPGEYSPAQLADELRQAGVSPEQLNAVAQQPLAGMAPQEIKPWEVKTPEREPLAIEASRAFPTGSPLDKQRAGVFSLDTPGQESPSATGFTGVGAPPAATGQGPGRRDHSDSLLRDARLALARADIETAQQKIAEARRLGVIYQLHEDSPQKVEALIQAAAQFRGFAPAATSDPAMLKQYAQFLLGQAEGLLPYNENVLARKLVVVARSLPVTYGPFDRSPDKLMQRIAGQAVEPTASESHRPSTAVAAKTGEPAAGELAVNEPGAGDSPLDHNRPPALPPVVADAARRGPSLPPRMGQLVPVVTELDRGHPATPADGRRQEAVRLLALARAALDRGELEQAKQLTLQAQSLQVPDTSYQPSDVRPWQLLMQIDKQLARRGSVVSFEEKNAVAQERPTSGEPFPTRPAVYDPRQDRSRIISAQSSGPLLDGQSPGAEQLFRQGMLALEQLDRQRALMLFQEAWKVQEELDPDTRRQLREKLTLLQAAAAAPLPPPGREASPLEELDAQQQLIREKLTREITSEQAAARKIITSEPRTALDKMQQLRARINQAEIDSATRKQMLTVVDQTTREFEQYIRENLHEIELNERNQEVLSAIEQERKYDIDVENKIAELVEEFNQMVDEERYAEAEVIAKRARELDADAPVVQLLVEKSRFLRRIREQVAIRDMKERGFYDQLTSVDRASAPFDDSQPYQFGDLKTWQQVSSVRQKWLEQQSRVLSPTEQAIQEALKTKVDVHFDKQPLTDVLSTLGRMAGINVHPDPQGLHAEGVTIDTPISIDLQEPVSLRSALNLILQPLRLSYVIQNEVLKITSEQTRDTDVYPRVYNVADLVIPIPNFVPSYNIGLPGAIREAYFSQGYGTATGGAANLPLTVASKEATGGGADHASVLAQMMNSPGAAGGSRAAQPLGFGPGGMGGAALADFDTLIELITSTISPQSWDEVGGPGSIEGFPTNLSLVVSQTQEVHEQIADLLEQLRRLQDLQVTIEVRFITLNDNFFERIGIDFDFDVDDNSTVNPSNPAFPDDTGPSISIGLDSTGQPTADLDFSFTHDSFGSTIPTFGGFDAGAAANFGFAILSDIEVFFLLQASQGDTRSNVLQAPKVTLFNGQQAFISDTSQRPFVTSVIPVVGDFAAAQQPVIVVLSEGTSLSVQAVVTNDRRFVRLTLVPFFSTIGDVEEFTFTGSETTNSGTNVADPSDDEQTVKNNVTTTREGTTVQLPTFAFTTVTTTVSVPDGGTVLLGGIKRLSEGRNERGVPMLSKVPYISRLFKNVGIGRTTQSLMLMVTPRIIIQEEEEEKMGIEITP